MKKVLLTLIVLALICGGVGFYMFNKPLESINSMKTDFSMAASELLTAFEDDETQANVKYLDKVIEIKGNVSKVDNKDGVVTIYLEADNPISNVIFQLEDSETQIQKGQEITLKGICTGYLMDVVLVRASQA